MSFEENLAEQLGEVNELLNQVLNETAENPEAEELVNNVRNQVAGIRTQLEGGSLEGLIGHILVLILSARQLIDVAKATDSGRKLKTTLSNIRDYYLKSSRDTQPNQNITHHFKEGDI